MLGSFVFLKIAYALTVASTIARSADFSLARWVGFVSAKWGRWALGRRTESMEEWHRVREIASARMGGMPTYAEDRPGQRQQMIGAGVVDLPVGGAADDPAPDTTSAGSDPFRLGRGANRERPTPEEAWAACYRGVPQQGPCYANQRHTTSWPLQGKRAYVSRETMLAVRSSRTEAQHCELTSVTTKPARAGRVRACCDHQVRSDGALSIHAPCRRHASG